MFANINIVEKYKYLFWLLDLTLEEIEVTRQAGTMWLHSHLTHRLTRTQMITLNHLSSALLFMTIKLTIEERVILHAHP